MLKNDILAFNLPERMVIADEYFSICKELGISPIDIYPGDLIPSTSDPDDQSLLFMINFNAIAHKLYAMYSLDSGEVLNVLETPSPNYPLNGKSPLEFISEATYACMEYRLTLGTPIDDPFCDGSNEAPLDSESESWDNIVQEQELDRERLLYLEREEGDDHDD